MESTGASEVYYATELAGIRGLVEVWSAQATTGDVDEIGILWTSRLLRTDNRTAKKETIPLWSDTGRYERRSRSEVGLFVMHHHLEVESWSPLEFHGCYVPLPF